MSFRSLFIGATLLALLPFGAGAAEITLLPSVKLQIGDRDRYGHYWDGGRWRDRNDWYNNWHWRKGRWHHDHGRHHGWDKRRAYERGYYDGRRDRGPHGSWRKRHH
ncbi:DUF2502 domain-containing protein [Tenebrionicola larvae]|jgi:hypothetical protein|uniref:DUF2502 domain-containing protein n=1 Tax=Tenebrionicola larvae TaxID=2815733 RepID=A0A949V0C6_9ENTR|nr:DUF2502 domain-containing protein [Tenebrionicola larvae]MBV5094923.1 DUF2502 domain-containing protein [Tenebrionicola larvae]